VFQSSSNYHFFLDVQEVTSSFLASFNIESVTEEISEILKTFSEVQQLFAALVPTEISYEEFWSRYYYRCDPVRIEKLWKEEERVAARKTKEKIPSLGLVKNLLGSAVSAVGKVAAPPAQKSMVPLGESLFASYGVVPEHFEDDEEELGWDDDEDDDVEQPDVGSDEEIIAFGTNNNNQSGFENLKLKLLSQSKEIENLQRKLNDSAVTSKDLEIEKLKAVVHERDTEICEIKSKFENLTASLDSKHVDNDLLSKLSEKDVEILRLTELLADAQTEGKTKDEKLVESVMKLKKAENDLLDAMHQSDSITKEEDLEIQRLHKTELDAVEDRVQQLTSENHRLQTQISSQLQSSKQSEARLEMQLKEISVERDELKTEVNKLHEEKGKVVRNSNNLCKGVSEETRSVDTGVKISADELGDGMETPPHSSSPSPVDAALATVNDDVEDDWGDAWGEDDE